MADEILQRADKICLICSKNDSKYNCPRCNILYCSLDCYKSQKHAECSESFYRDCVAEELASSQPDDQSKQKMVEILNRFREENANNEFDNPEELMKYLEQNSGEDEVDNESSIDSDDDETVELQDRINGLNLNYADALWNALTEDERNEFEALVRAGDVSNFVPMWQPWWLHSKESKLVEEVSGKEKQSSDDTWLEKCPPLMSVAPFSTITSSKPADCVKYNIINVLASYAFVVRYFNGELEAAEAVHYLLAVSGTFSSNTNFEDETSAVEAVVQCCFQSPLIETDKNSLDVMKHDLYLILRGPSKNSKSFYCKAALSHVCRMLEETKESKKRNKGKVIAKTTAKEKEFVKKFPEHGQEYLPSLESSKIKSCIKKIEYYLSYIESYGMPSCE